jgi:hypothetical protein
VPCRASLASSAKGVSDELPQVPWSCQAVYVGLDEVEGSSRRFRLRRKKRELDFTRASRIRDPKFQGALAIEGSGYCVVAFSMKLKKVRKVAFHVCTRICNNGMVNSAI